jgi:spore coat protein U-like protein
MKRLLKSLLLAGTALAVLAAARPAEAQQITITANVPAVCRFTNSATIAFASYDPVTANATVDATQTGTITLQCTKGTSFTVAISDGASFTTTRRMAGPLGPPAEFLNYELYQDAGHTARWGSVGAELVTGTSVSMAPDVHTVYAMIPAAQDVAVGAYQDVVNVTVTP